MTEMRVVTWNVAGRSTKLREQAEALIALNPDIIALQEITASTEPRWRELLEKSEICHVCSSREVALDSTVLTGPRKYTQITAARWPIRGWPEGAFNVPWRERVLSAEIQSPAGGIEFHTTHVPPGSSHGWKKIDHCRGIFERLSVPHVGHRLLCGDFNSPQSEMPDGTVHFWGERQRKNGTWAPRSGRGPEWCAGERSVILDLAAHDLPDVFRQMNGAVISDFSWYTRNGRGRRFDHIFASESLSPTACWYWHEGRTAGLSDHSALVADFEPSTAEVELKPS